MKTSKKVIFFIQGEGRGHFTQAIKMTKLLLRHHMIPRHVFISGTRPPSYVTSFFKNYGIEFSILKSPTLVISKHNNSVNLFSSFIYNLLRIPSFLNEIRNINSFIKFLQPDLILNFHDLMCGSWKLLYQNPTPVISIAHQYIYFHSQFKFPSELSAMQTRELIWINRLATFGSERILAPNFAPLDSEGKLNIIPPLIDIESHPDTKDIDLTMYFLYPFLDNLALEWKKHFPQYSIHVFRHGEEKVGGQDLFFHSLSRSQFLSKLSASRFFIGTSGFESVCEALYYGCKVAVIPVKNHIEQIVNASELEKYKLGVWLKEPTPAAWERSLNHMHDSDGNFIEWCSVSEEICSEILKIYLS